MSIKRHLNALLHRTRGGHSFHKVRESIANMEEQEAQEWYRFITNAVEDAKMQAKNQARNRGGFFASAKGISVDEIVNFLDRQYYGKMGGAYRVTYRKSSQKPEWDFIQVEPQRRESYDYLGISWEDWQRSYVQPIVDDITSALNKKFGKGLRVNVTEKGFVDIEGLFNGSLNIIRPSDKKASQQRVAARYLDKISSESLGELEYYPVTTRGRTTYEVIIEWADDKVWRSKEAMAIQKDLDNTLYEALTKFSKKHPNLS